MNANEKHKLSVGEGTGAAKWAGGREKQLQLSGQEKENMVGTGTAKLRRNQCSRVEMEIGASKCQVEKTFSCK